MEFWLYLLLFYMPSLVESARDPVEGWLPSEIALRDLDCTPMTTEGAQAVAPGRVPEASPRGDFMDRRAVLCRERLMPQGVRRPQDDAILSELRATAKELAALVEALDPPQRERTWQVEVFYPDASVAHKIGFAVKNALLDRGRRVSDRVPTLAGGDILVLATLSPQTAYQLACTRYAALGSLGPNDALLAIVLRHPRETALHAGICLDGRWRWLQ